MVNRGALLALACLAVAGPGGGCFSPTFSDGQYGCQDGQSRRD
jgi:hypothetical protein